VATVARRPVLVTDFDGVLNEYGSGDFAEPLDPNGPAVEGSVEALILAAETCDIVVASSRVRSQEDSDAILAWLLAHGYDKPVVIVSKPLGDMYLDDRGRAFNGPGTFPTPEQIADFEPWWKLHPPLPPVEGGTPQDLAASLVARAQQMDAPITEIVQAAASAAGGDLVALEHRVKGPITTAEKLATLQDEKGLSLTAAAHDIKDSLRYAVVFPPTVYLTGVASMLGQLDANQITTDRLRNYWDDRQDPSPRDAPGTYLAMNAVMAVPNDYRFEIQFHTPDGWVANNVMNWELYRQSRDPDLTEAEREEVWAKMRANLEEVERPVGALSLAGAAQPQPPKVSARAHNRVLDAAQKRVDKLEPRLAAIIEEILDRAGTRAANLFQERATRHGGVPDPALIAAAANSDVARTSTMIALKPRADEAAALADPDGDPPENLHVTLAYLGDNNQPLSEIADALKPVVATHGPLSGVVGGLGMFHPPGVGIALPDVRGLSEVRQDVVEALAGSDIDYARDHGFTAHITINGDGEPPDPDLAGKPLHFDSIHVVRGHDEEIELPLVGVRALTAAGPDWSPPFADELINVDSLVQQILDKTEPVRKALIEQTMTPALEQAGVSFDVSNPLTAKLFADTGSQVTNIAMTTRANLMDIIGKSYQNGLTIPATRDLIRQGMRAASKTRATMIARTEMARAVNGGSLTATQLVEQETGQAYNKVWHTAPGARYPRHELYDGLDGQTVGTDETFTVGDDQLQYPGDPNGEPGETINCRCAISYVEVPKQAGGLAGIADGIVQGVGDEIAGVLPTIESDLKKLITDEGGAVKLPKVNVNVPKPDLVTANVEEAAKALGEGKRVELTNASEVNTFIDDLGRMAADAQKAGKAAPNLDLAKVSVKGTNLFAHDSLGVPRIDMPQLVGIPIPGSPAAALPHQLYEGKDFGWVDISKPFFQSLRDQGVAITEEEVNPETLRATQDELNGPKVAKEMDHLEAQAPPELNSLNPTGTVYADYDAQSRAVAPLGPDMTTLDKTMGVAPDHEVTIYRGVATADKINPGDFVTTNRQLAQDYAGNGKVLELRVPASHILDSKSEPLGEEYLYRPPVKVSALAPDETEPVIISRDNYILDGHHRWAASIGRDYQTGVDVPTPINVERIDEPITTLLQQARDYSKQMGIPPQSAFEATKTVVTPPVPAEAVAPATGAAQSIDIGITPFRAGIDKEVGFYDSAKYKQFINDVNQSGQAYGVHIDSIDKVKGIWEGDTEPSVSIHVSATEPTPADESYKIQHTAPGVDDSPLYDVTAQGSYPSDFYDPKAPGRLEGLDAQLHLFSGGGDEAADRAILNTINSVHGDPNAVVTIYRAVPGNVNTINPGDWVTLSKSYADMNVEANLGAEADGHVISMQVPASQVFTDGNSLAEMGWNPPNFEQFNADARARAWAANLGKAYNQDGVLLFTPPTPVGPQTLDAVKALHPNVELQLSEHDNGIVVSLIRTQEQGQGLASAAMKDLLTYADQYGKTVVLTPEPVGTGLSKTALTKWYRSLGFKPNTGAKADLRFAESMIRQPEAVPGSDSMMATFQQEFPQDQIAAAMEKAGISGGRFTADGRLQVIGSGEDFVKQLQKLAQELDLVKPGKLADIGKPLSFRPAHAGFDKFFKDAPSWLTKKIADPAGDGEDLRVLWGETAGINDQYGLSTVTEAQQKAAQDAVYKATQASLENRGLPEEVTVWRKGNVVPGDVESFSLYPNQGVFRDQIPYMVKREDILVDTNAFFPKYADEHEVMVMGSKATPLTMNAKYDIARGDFAMMKRDKGDYQKALDALSHPKGVTTLNVPTADAPPSVDLPRGEPITGYPTSGVGLDLEKIAKMNDAFLQAPQKEWIDHVMNEEDIPLGVNMDKVSDSMEGMVEQYTQSGSQDINGILSGDITRANFDEKAQQYGDYGEAMDSAKAMQQLVDSAPPLPEGTTLYRGINPVGVDQDLRDRGNSAAEKVLADFRDKWGLDKIDPNSEEGRKLAANPQFRKEREKSVTDAYDAITKVVGDWATQQYPVGSYVAMGEPGEFESLTLNPALAARFGGGDTGAPSVVFKIINAKTGAPIFPFSSFTDESEVLAPPDTMYRVRSVQLAKMDAVGDLGQSLGSKTADRVVVTLEEAPKCGPLAASLVAASGVACTNVAQYVPDGKTPKATVGNAVLFPGQDRTIAEQAAAHRDAAIARYARDNGMSVADYKAAATESIRSYIAQHPQIRIRLTHDALDQVINDGKFVNEFGLPGVRAPMVEGRVEAEKNLFGIPANAGSADRPIYGYLAGTADETGEVQEYGDIIVNLDPSVNARATFTIGDSYSEGILGHLSPSLLSDPSIGSWDGSFDIVKAFRDGDIGKISRYVEVEIHGGLPLSDVGGIKADQALIVAREDAIRVKEAINAITEIYANNKGTQGESQQVEQAGVPADKPAQFDYASALREIGKNAGLRQGALADLIARVGLHGIIAGDFEDFNVVQAIGKGNI
jgi:2'-5' RNA ligase